MTRALVVVPMKDPDHAKTRLGPALDHHARRELTLHLFNRTMQALNRARAFSRHGFDIATVTASSVIAAVARDHGATVIDEVRAKGLNAALVLAADWAAARGRQNMTILPGDLAAPTQTDLLSLLDRPAEGRAIICASRDGGTNALRIPLPCPIPMLYGPGSFAAHLAALRRAGVRCLTPNLPSLRTDIDRLHDLPALPTMPRLALSEVRR